MISEGSRDTEDWSNAVENSDLYHTNKQYFKRKQIFEIIINSFTVLLIK